LTREGPSRNPDNVKYTEKLRIESLEVFKYYGGKNGKMDRRRGIRPPYRNNSIYIFVPANPQLVTKVYTVSDNAATGRNTSGIVTCKQTSYQTVPFNRDPNTVRKCYAGWVTPDGGKSWNMLCTEENQYKQQTTLQYELTTTGPKNDHFLIYTQVVTEQIAARTFRQTK